MRSYFQIIIAFCFLPPVLIGQVVDGNFFVEQVNNKYAVTVAAEMQSDSGAAGVASIEFSFNNSALSYPDLPVENIDFILYGDFQNYITKNITKSAANKVRISLVTVNPPPPVPLTTEPLGIITLYFTILNSSLESNLIWTQTNIAPEFLQNFYTVGNWTNYTGIPVNVEDEGTQITEFKLYQNYPNPFNPGTVINYQLPVSSNVILKVYDILGNEVAILVDEFKLPGSYEVMFDASHLSSGVYIYKMQGEDFIETKKLNLIK